MKRFLALMLLLVPALAFGATGKEKKADKETEAWRYEIESLSVGVQGTCVLRVWSFSKKPTVATEQSKKNAVHGVIFKGVASLDRIPGKKALVTPEEAANNEKFFDEFFAEGGEYMRYVALTNTGAGADDVLKVGKEYKVGVAVVVSYNDLRSFLESKGVVKKLDAGF